MFILLDLLICLIYALVLIWLGLEFGLVWKNSASVVVPRLLRQHSRGLLICLGGREILWDSARVLATGLCVVCFVCYDWSMYVLIFSSVLGGAVLPVAVDGSPWSLPCPRRVI